MRDFFLDDSPCAPNEEPHKYQSVSLNVMRNLEKELQDLHSIQELLQFDKLDAQTKKLLSAYFQRKVAHCPKEKLDWYYDGYTLLHNACMLGDSDLIIHLVKLGASLTKHADNEDRYFGVGHGDCPIHLLFSHNQSNVSHLLPLLTSTPEAASCRGKFGGTVLHSAAYSGNLEAVKWLVEERQFDINSKDDAKYFPHSPLYIAATHGHAAVVDYLLNHGACYEKELLHAFTSPLAKAILNGHADIAQVFYNHGRWLSPHEEKHLIHMAESLLATGFETSANAIYFCLGIPQRTLKNLTRELPSPVSVYQFSVLNRPKEASICIKSDRNMVIQVR